MTNNTTHKPLHKFDPRVWQPKTKEGEEAKKAYLEMLARQEATKVRARDDEEKLRVVQALIAEIEQNRRKDYQEETPSESENTYNNNNNSEHPLFD